MPSFCVCKSMEPLRIVLSPLRGGFIACLGVTSQIGRGVIKMLRSLIITHAMYAVIEQLIPCLLSGFIMRKGAAYKLI